MRRWALMIGAACANVVEQDGPPTIEGPWLEVTGLSVGPGWTRPEGTWVAPPPPARHVTRLAFLSRFTDNEAIAFDLSSIGATVPAAALRRFMNKANAARYIDLDRPDARAGVQALEAAGLIAAGRAAEVLDAPVQSHERYEG